MTHEESHIQSEIIQEFQQRGIYAFSVPNEAALSARRQMFLKTLGLRNGVSDLVVLMYRRVIFMEVKTEQGEQSKAQKDFENICIERGLEYHVVRSVEDAVSIVSMDIVGVVANGGE